MHSCPEWQFIEVKKSIFDASQKNREIRDWVSYHGVKSLLGKNQNTTTTNISNNNNNNSLFILGNNVPLKSTKNNKNTTFTHK